MLRFRDSARLKITGADVAYLEGGKRSPSAGNVSLDMPAEDVADRAIFDERSDPRNMRVFWSHPPESNRRPADYELSGLVSHISGIYRDLTG